MIVHSHHSAARMWGLWLIDDDGAEHRTIPSSAGHRPHGVKVHYGELDQAEVTTHNGVPLTTLARTVIDMAMIVPPWHGLAVADSALALHRIEQADLVAAAAKRRGAGSKHARWVARHADGRSGSALESEARARFIQAGVGRMLLQVRLRADGHAYDLGVHGTRVLVEIDGTGHCEPARMNADAEDGVEAILEGHILFRFTSVHVRKRPAWMIAVVAAKVAEHHAEARREKARRRAARHRAARQIGGSTAA